MTELLILSITVLFLGSIAFIVYWRGAQLDVLSIYTIMVGLYFGPYTILDLLINGADDVAPESAVLAIGSVMVCTTIVCLMYLLMPSDYGECLLLRNLVSHWRRVDTTAVMLSSAAAIIFQAYVFVTYGVLTHVYTDDLEKIGIDIPSWIAPSRELANCVAFAAILFYFSKLIGRSKLGWANGLLLVVSIAMFGLLGRRALFNIGMIGLFILLVENKKHTISLRAFALSVLAVIVLLFFSNIYQTYRHDLSYQAAEAQSETIALVEAAGNFQATIDNLSDRIAMWRFNEMIVAKQLDHPLNVLGGELTWQALKNSIPGAVWQRKEVVDIDEMVAIFYDFPVTDYPTSNFSTLQADYGFGMVLLASILSIGVIFLIMSVNRIAPRRPFIFLMVSGFALQYLINIENSLGDIFILFRNVALISCVYIGFETIRMCYQTVIQEVFVRPSC